VQKRTKGTSENCKQGSSEIVQYGGGSLSITGCLWIS